MKTEKSLLHHLHVFSTATLAVLLLAGCQSAPPKSASQTAPAPAASVAPATQASAPAAPAAPEISLPIRIKAAATDAFTDSSGNHWLPDRGFADGETTERSDVTITNTADQEIYRSERYSMTGFTQPLPNGKYVVKLHFCETYDGITGPGQRVFSFNVAGHEFKDFDVWVKAGGPLRAYVETVPVEITDGKLVITFTANVENPQINGIEILPAS
jgi:hypothetical protein